MRQVKQPFTRLRSVALGVAAIAVLAACDPVAQSSDDPPEPGVLEATRNGPADAAPGTCWGKTVSPAVVERVTEQVQIKPAKVNPDGTVASPPVYRTEEKQVIVTARRDNWFETPCPDVMTVEFISTLQRAMQARGNYAGPISGVLDPSTRKAVLRVQRQNGLDSSVLSLETARNLGLVAVPRDTTD